MARLNAEQKAKRKEKLTQEGRTVGMLGKYGLAGLIGGVPDTLGFAANLPSYVGNYLGGNYQSPYEYVTPHIAQGIDELTGQNLEPQNFTQRALARGAEFVGSGRASAIPKAASYIGKFIAPQNIKDYGALVGTGAGVETAREIKPDSTLAQILGGFAGGSVFNIPSVVPNAKQAAINYSNKGFTPPPSTLGEAIKNKEAAARIGTHLTPAEASGNPFMAAKEARLGVTKENAQNLYDRKMANFENQNTAIENLYESIAPANNKKKLSPDEAIRESARKIIETEEKSLKEKAEPLYTAVEKKTIGEKSSHTNITKEYSLDQFGEPMATRKKEIVESIKYPKKISQDPTIVKAIEDTLNDPKYAVDIKGYEKNSVKVLDLAKRRIDADIAKYAAQDNGDVVRVLQASKKRLTDTIDKIHPQYKKARSIYEEGKPHIEKIEGSAIGKIARREDATLKNVGKDLFDSTQTNHNAFLEVRDKLLKSDPDAWRNIVRQEMERRVGSSKSGGFNFYNKIARDKKVYRQYHDALEGLPHAQQKLADMERAFKTTLEPITPRTAAGLAKSSLDVPRSTGEFLQKTLAKFGGKEMDKAAIDLIMNPNWDKEFQNIRKLPTQAERNQGMSVLLNTVLQSSRENEKEKGPQENAPQIQGIPNYQEMSDRDVIEDFIKKGDFSNLSKEELMKLKDRYEALTQAAQ